MKHYLGNDLPNKNASKFVRLGDLTRTVKRGLSSYYLQGDDVEVPMINIKDLANVRIIIDAVDHVSVRKTPLLERSRIESGDVILAIRGFNFKAAVADESVRNAVISANLIALTLSEEVKPELIAAYFNSPLGQNMIRARASGATIKGLNSRDLLDISIPLPPLSVQESLSRYLTLAREYDDLLLKELSLRQKLTDAVVLRIMR
ncbi:MAG TPA: restriction endonuclease subunit S [Methanothrix soehngenii]|nr:restriction endonuclease subunit S [Methanothrix soehngenii]